MLYYLLIITGLVLFDQVSKYLIVKYMKEGQTKVIKKHFFRFTFIKNSGASLGILEGQTTLLSIISFLATLIFGYFLYTVGSFQDELIYTFALLFIISGAIGNFIDRLLRKAVVDFLDFRLFGHDLPIFNIADFMLGLGMIGLIIDIIL